MTLLQRQETLTKISEFEELPSIPQIILRVREISEDPKSSVADLANIILSDHTLTSKILRLANSAFYAEYASRVSTITQAIILMGFRAVQNVVMSLALCDWARAAGHGHKFDLQRFWSDSLGVGVIGKLIAKASRYPVPEEAFIAGFMHNIGTVVLAVIFPEEYDVVLKRIREGEDHVAAERAVFGLDHAEAGGLLARTWNLPPLLSRPIADHHRKGTLAKGRTGDRMVDMIQAADMIYRLVNCQKALPTEDLDDTYRRAAELAAVPPEVLKRIVATAPELTREIAGDLDISLRAAESVAADQPVETAASAELIEISRQLDDRSRQLAVVQEATEAIRAAESEEAVCQMILEEIYRGLGLGRAILLQIDYDARLARGIMGFGVKSQESVYEMVIPLDSGILGRCVTDLQAVNVLDGESAAYRDGLNSRERELIDSRAFAALPFDIAGKVEMVLLANNREGDEPVHDDALKLILSLISQAAMAIERLRLSRQLAQLKDAEVGGLIDTALS